MKVHLISSRFRVSAIGSTWVVAVVGNCLGFYTYELIDVREETLCTKFYYETLSVGTYERVRTILFLVAPLVAMTIFYCVIAVTLGREDKAVQCLAVYQKGQRKRRAIKMTFCVMVAFYITFLPILLGFLIRQYEITVSCSFLEALWFLAPGAVYISSMINPLLCMLSVQSYRHGLKEIFNSCWSKRFTTYNMEKNDQKGVSLQEIRLSNLIEDCS